MDNLLHTPENLHTIDSTLVEEDSYHYLNKYLRDHSHYEKYSYPEKSLDAITTDAINFCLFSAKIKVGKELIHSFKPLAIVRYVLHEDLTYSNYYTNHRQPGYIVEGYVWTNGLLYQVRQDKPNNFKIYERTILVDNPTAYYMKIGNNE